MHLQVVEMTKYFDLCLNCTKIQVLTDVILRHDAGDMFEKTRKTHAQFKVFIRHTGFQI